MFRESEGTPPGQLLVTGGGSGPGSDVNLTEVGGAAIALGQAVAAASLPVVIASDQSAVPVSGTVTATGPLTDAQLRATAVPISGTVTATGPLTDTQLRATPVPVSGTVTATGTVAVTQSTSPWVTSFSAPQHIIADSGTITTVGAVTAITNALPAGSNVIGHVIADTGSTTAVTGNVTVVQPTGTSLHAVLDTTSTTAVTQATASSLNATVVGSGAAGTAATGVVTVQGIASMTKLLVTPDSVALPANQSVNLAQVNGTTTVNGGSAAGILAVGGPNATNVAITGNPTNLGAQAVSAENTAVTATRMAQLVTDLVGKLIVLPYANPENFVSGTITSAMTGTTTTSLIAAPASGLRNYITQITVSNGSITVPTDILIQDGSGGTTLYVIPAPIGTGTGTGTAGATLTFPTPLRQPTTATAIFVANVTTGSSTKVSASGYKGI